MPANPPLSARSETVLVRVAPEILKLLEDGKASPVIVLSVDRQDDGTYDMVLQTPQVTEDMIDRGAEGLAAERISSGWRDDAEACLRAALDYRST